MHTHHVLRGCLLLLATMTIAPPAVTGAQWEPLAAGTQASLRGLSVAGDGVIWASGQRGSVLRSTDGGTHWTDVSIPGATRYDVRAIHARDARVAHAAATAGRIWRTTDGGTTWVERYAASDTAVFLDAIVFFDDRRGVALGDPIGGRFLLLVTDDGGETWLEAADGARPSALDGEAAFAASGSSLAVSGTSHVWLGTGGKAARVFRSTDSGTNWEAIPAPVAAGEASTGVFAVAFADHSAGVLVGGDYQRPELAGGTAAFSVDGGRTWNPSRRGPRGYRSGVALFRDGARVLAIAVGTSGTDVSTDSGQSWSGLDESNFNAVQVAPDGVAFAVGPGGRVARLDLKKVAERAPSNVPRR